MSRSKHRKHREVGPPSQRGRWGRRAARVAVVVGLQTILLGASVAVPILGDHRGETDAVAELSGRVGADQKLVFAHYFPPYPISLDNVDPAVDYYASQYLNPDGLHGQYSEFGGMLRDRPPPRAPRPEANWRELDLQEEVAQASAAGIDGFSVDILTPAASEDWVSKVPALLLRAAQTVDPHFKIMLMPDMHAELKNLTPAQMADEIAALAVSPSVFRLTDGRIVVSPFSAENRPPQWWRAFLHEIKANHGLDVALVPVFLDASDDLIESFRDITYGMSAWGGRNPAFNPVSGFPLEMIHGVEAMQQEWMQPVSMQDYRPVHQIYDEAENTTNLRNTWQIAIDADADWVQLITWNDFGESTAMGPSVLHGRTLLDLNAYYIAWFKGGVPPGISHDRVFLSHRTQLIDSGPYADQAATASLRSRSVPGRDTVEALSMLKEPGQVTVSVGGDETVCDVSAGVSTCVAFLGEVRAPDVAVQVKVTRRGQTVIDMLSPYRVTAHPSVQDLTYTVSEGRAMGS